MSSDNSYSLCCLITLFVYMMSIIFSFFFVLSKHPPEALETACSFSLNLEDQVQHTQSYLGLAPVLFPFHFPSWCEGALQEKKPRSYSHLMDLLPSSLEYRHHLNLKLMAKIDFQRQIPKNRIHFVGAYSWKLILWDSASFFKKNFPTVFPLHFTLLQMSAMTCG